ncbi:MAG: caspase family protein, partial [Planctomycetales bacterium]|nr:caspase family protein [Planctomycetales bacterium]
VFPTSQSDRGPLLVVGGESGQMAAFELRPNGKLVTRRRFFGHQSFVTAISQSPDGQMLASSSIDGTIRLWSLADIDKQIGDVDFKFRGNQILGVASGTESERVGIRSGDTIMKLDGKSFYEAQERWIREAFQPFETVELQLRHSDGRDFQAQFTLQPGASHVEPLLNVLLIEGDPTVEDEWVMWTPNGYYDASPAGDHFIGWHVNEDRNSTAKFFKADQFRKELYQPVVIDNILKTKSPESAVQIVNAASQQAPIIVDQRQANRLERLAPPVVKFVYPKDGDQTSVQQISVLADIIRSNEADIQKIRIKVNGYESEVVGNQDESLATDGRIGFSQSVSLQPGENTLSATVETNYAVSRTEQVKIYYQPRTENKTEVAAHDGRLFVLAIGVADYRDPRLQDLRYADRDALDFVSIWKNQPTSLYTTVHAHCLTNAEASITSVREAIQGLIDAKPTAQDLVLIFYSGHGIRDDHNFYLATHESDLDQLRSTALTHLEIGNLVTNELAHCRRILFIDSCHGSAAGGAEIIGRDPWSSFGAVVFASSKYREKSVERDEWQNGAFTEALMEAFRISSKTSDPAASIVRDDVVSALELKQFLHERVRVLTGDVQHASTKWPLELDDFTLARRITAVSPDRP